MAVDRQAKPGITSEASLEKTTHFLKEVQTELKKTTWPTRAEALRLTYVVIAVIGVLGFYMAGLDIILTNLVNRFIH